MTTESQVKQSQKTVILWETLKLVTDGIILSGG